MKAPKKLRSAGSLALALLLSGCFGMDDPHQSSLSPARGGTYMQNGHLYDTATHQHSRSCWCNT